MRASSTKVIALVDRFALSRDCLMQSLLPRLGQHITIKPYASVAEMVASTPAKFDLMLFYVHDDTRDSLAAAIEAIADMPMPILGITNERTIRLDLGLEEQLWSGLCGLVSTADADSKLLSAGIQFVLSGGTFFPLEMMVRQPSQEAAPPPSRRSPGALTARQAEVFAKLQQGKPNKLIAYELGMSESTVKVHVRSIMTAIGATNRTQAVSLGRRRFGFDGKSQGQD